MVAVVVCANHYIDLLAFGHFLKSLREVLAETSINKARKLTAFEMEGVPTTNIQGDKSVGMAHDRCILLFRSVRPVLAAVAAAVVGFRPATCGQQPFSRGQALP